MITEVEGWSIDTFKYYFTYAGLLEGSPTMFDIPKLLASLKKDYAKNYFYEAEKDVSVFPRYDDYPTNDPPFTKILKRVTCIFKIYNFNEPDWEMASIITFCDTNEEIEDVIKEALKNENLIKRAWDF